MRQVGSGEFSQWKNASKHRIKREPRQMDHPDRSESAETIGLGVNKT
jgi:hypothetical protein